MKKPRRVYGRVRNVNVLDAQWTFEMSKRGVAIKRKYKRGGTVLRLSWMDMIEAAQEQMKMELFKNGAK